MEKRNRPSSEEHTKSLGTLKLRGLVHDVDDLHEPDQEKSGEHRSRG